MSFAGLIMDVLLVVLLLAALGFGFRLERKLKALRQGQEAFARAVGDLDAAARRAESGLAQLREATDEAHDSLHERILKARELKTQLETLIARAERVPSPRAEGGPEGRVGSLGPSVATPPVASRHPPHQGEGRPRPSAPRRFDEDLFEPVGDRSGVRP